MTPASIEWHEDMRGRVRALLILTEEQLPDETADLVSDLIDSNEYGVALEVLSDMLVEARAVLTAEVVVVTAELAALMGLDSNVATQLQGLVPPPVE